MREIKFRGKRIDNGRWVYGQYFKTPLTDENSGTLPEAGWFFLTGEPRHCIVQDGVSFVIDVNTLGQYTGLKDKSGKEIYESDIIKSFTQIGEVKYELGVYYVEWMKENYKSYLSDAIRNGEIIGNIYEDTKLLESE